MAIGGVQKALLNLLRQSTQFDVTLVLLAPTGELMDELPDWVNVQSARGPLRFFGMSQARAMQDGVAAGAVRALLAVLCRLFGNHLVAAACCAWERRVTGFDLAISYLHAPPQRSLYGGCNELVLSRIGASSKVAFIHSDLRATDAMSPRVVRMYEQFDEVISVSESCAAIVRATLPTVSSRVEVVRNCVDVGRVRRLSCPEEERPADSGLVVVTVARLGREKQVPEAIKVVDSLISKGLQIDYWVVGGGVDAAECRALTLSSSNADRFRIWGPLSNPYPVMAAADLLLVPSAHEAAPLVFQEAAALGIPVLTTSTTSAVEMVERPGFGWVCRSLEDIGRKLEALYLSPEEVHAAAERIRASALDYDHGLKDFVRLVERHLGPTARCW